MNISLQAPNQRLLFFLAAIILILSLLAFDRLLSPPAGCGVITIGLLLLLLGIAGAVLYDILPGLRKSPGSGYSDSGSLCSQRGSGNPWVQKANKYLIIWCLCLAYEILFVMFFPVLIDSFAISGTIGLPAVTLIGIPAFFLVMIWSEKKYWDSLRWLDPDRVQIIARSVGSPPAALSELDMVALFGLIYMTFLGRFIGYCIRPFLLPFLPASGSPFLNPLLGGVTLALFATPSLIYVIYRRSE
jgi:hypothetical protein